MKSIKGLVFNEISDPFKLKKVKILDYTSYVYMNLEETDKLWKEFIIKFNDKIRKLKNIADCLLYYLLLNCIVSELIIINWIWFKVLHFSW